ncbi:MAG: NifB/NifX family molybdenum-iron cluster-binding protein [Eubacteriales bacterium]
MKIAIPVNEMDIRSEVCISFGRTPYFALYDTDTSEYAYLDNSAAAAQGGAGIKAAQSLADSGAQVVVTPRCGDNAAEVLSGAEIKIYKSVPGTIEENVKAFLDGKLSELNEIHPGFHNHGNK